MINTVILKHYEVFKSAESCNVVYNKKKLCRYDITPSGTHWVVYTNWSIVFFTAHGLCQDNWPWLSQLDQSWNSIVFPLGKEGQWYSTMNPFVFPHSWEVKDALMQGEEDQSHLKCTSTQWSSTSQKHFIPRITLNSENVFSLLLQTAFGMNFQQHKHVKI